MLRDPLRIEALEPRLLLAAHVVRATLAGPVAHAVGSITGRVYRDVNSSGAQDGGETGINGVTVFLDLNNSGTFDGPDTSVVANGGGNYSFAGLADGTYSVGQVTPAGYLRIGNAFQSATVAGGNVERNWFDFPVVLTGSNGSDQWLVRMDPSNASRFQCLETLLGQTFPGTIYSITKSLLTTFTINAQSGDDQLAIDYSVNGNPIPTGGFNYDASNQSTPTADHVTITGTSAPDDILITNYDGGQGNGAIAMKGVENVTLNGGQGTDTLTFCGTDNADTLTLQGGDLVVNGTCTIMYISVEAEVVNALGGNDIMLVTSTVPGITSTVNGGNGNDSMEMNVGMLTPLVFNGGTLISDHDILDVNVGTFNLNADVLAGTPNLTANVAVNGTLVMNSSQHFESLSVAGQASVGADGDRVIVTKALSITGTGELDLADNDMIVDYSDSTPMGTWAGSTYTGLCGMIASGYADDDWNGAGINTSAATSRTSLGCAEAGSVLNYNGGQTALFDGETVDATAILVKYTWTGDANLDGKINIDDYVRTDFSAPIQLKTWSNGDFNYDGKVNIDDYVEMDFVLPIQGPPL